MQKSTKNRKQQEKFKNKKVETTIFHEVTWAQDFLPRQPVKMWSWVQNPSLKQAAGWPEAGVQCYEVTASTRSLKVYYYWHQMGSDSARYGRLLRPCKCS
jgi:hypothetical protein